MARQFTSLNHPEPDEDGVQRYAVFEVITSPRYKKVATDLTSAEVTAYVEKFGEWQK